ncbi:MAG: MFS transporter [Saprospiraceae bacterium]
MTRKELLLLIVLAALQFCHIVDFMIVMPLGEKFMTDFNIGPGEFSWLVSVYAGAAFVASLASAGFVDRFDRRSALLFAHVGFTVGTLACGLMDSFYPLLICRGITGAFGGLVATQVLAIVGDYFPIERRGRAMGAIMTAFSVASVVGVPIGINLAAWKGWSAPFLVVGILAVLFGVLAFFQVPSLKGHITSAKDRPTVGQMFTGVAANPNQRLALIFTVVLMLGHFTVIPFIATYMQVNLGMGDGQLSLMYMIGGALTVVSLPIIGKLVDRFGAPKVFTYGSVATIGVILATTNLPAGLPLAGILLVTSIFFVASGARTVPAITLVTGVVKPENRGGFMSLRASFNQAGMGAAAFISGLIISEGPNGELLHYGTVGILAAVMGVIAVFLAWRLKAIA